MQRRKLEDAKMKLGEKVTKNKSPTKQKLADLKIKHKKLADSNNKHPSGVTASNVFQELSAAGLDISAGIPVDGLGPNWLSCTLG